MESFGHKQTDLFGTLFEHDVENEPIDRETLKDKLYDSLNIYKRPVLLTKFIAYFFTINGIICKINDIKSALRDLEVQGKIDVIRLSKDGRNYKSRSFTDSKELRVFIKLK